MKKFRSHLGHRALEAYLFGSHAQGTATQDSDIDLILVTPTDKPWPERGKDFFDLLDTFSPLDLLVYTPQEWQRLRSQSNPLIAAAQNEWRRVV